LRNRATKSALKTLIRRLREAIAAGEAEQAWTALKRVESALDKAAKRGILHRNTAARKKSRLKRHYLTAFASTKGEVNSVTE